MKRKNESGNILVFTALGMTMLMGVAGLAVDVGALRHAKRLQQTAADAAALAGASNYVYSSGVTAGAKAASAANGFTDGANNVTVTVNSPPSALSVHSGTAGYVEVLVKSVQPTYFMRIFGINTANVTARAVAASLGEGTNGGCLYTLGTSGNDITMNGTPNIIQAPGCGIVDNGGLRTNGSGVTINAGSIGVSGSFTHNGGGSFTPTPVTGIPPSPDPLSYLTPPSSACSGSASVTINGTSKVQTVPAGNYCGGIVVNGTSNQVTLNQGAFGNITVNGSGNTVTFNPGTYVVTGSGGLSDNGSNSVLSGNGVTFYLTTGSVNFNGSTGGTLTAPTTGSYAGMLFWEPPTNTSGFTLNGKSTFKTDGIMYAPKATITLNGNNSFSAYMILVVQSITMNGNNTVNLGANTSSPAWRLPHQACCAGGVSPNEQGPGIVDHHGQQLPKASVVSRASIRPEPGRVGLVNAVFRSAPAWGDRDWAIRLHCDSRGERGEGRCGLWSPEFGDSGGYNRNHHGSEERFSH